MRTTTTTTTTTRVRRALTLAVAAALTLAACGTTTTTTTTASDPCDPIRDAIAETMDYRGDPETIACLGMEDDPRAYAAIARGAAQRLIRDPSDARARAILAEGWSDPR